MKSKKNLDPMAEAMREDLLQMLEERLQPHFDTVRSEHPDWDEGEVADEVDRRVDGSALFEEVCNEYRESLIGGKLQ